MAITIKFVKLCESQKDCEMLLIKIDKKIFLYNKNMKLYI